MRKFKVLVVCALLALAAGCGSKEEKKGGSADKADEAGEAKGGADVASDAVICCEFNGATGTSTKAKCDEFKGKVVGDDKCKK